AVDSIDQIVALREKLFSEGIYYYIHVDAAYGGYARSIFLDENNNFIPFDDLQKVHHEYGVFTENTEYITKEVYEAFKAI
ncbi:tyrosine decarboxylase, partial [Staphylococcus epidermidis]